MNDPPLTDTERYPLLDEVGRQLLRRLREHPSAPRYNHRCGDRLGAEGLARVRAFEAQVRAEPPGWTPDAFPPWLPPFVDRCLLQVPFYRRYGGWSSDFTSLPTCARADLSREPWAFVPDDQPLDDLLVYCTSGTTGEPLDVLSHPQASSAYLPLLRAALVARGVSLEDLAARVAIVLVCFQLRTYTYASISSYLDGAGFAKVNLNPSDWRHPDDRVRFLDDLDPLVYTGDPISFAALRDLPLHSRPRALISTSMTLLPALQADLEAYFGCPVLDLYAMNEAGPIAVAVDGGHRPLQPRLYLEVLDEQGAPCPPGERGELALSGGFNPFLPLLRYRTGDQASLAYRGDQPLLVGLEGRPPVVFRAADGRAINNADVTAALKHLALPRYRLHQARTGALRLEVARGRVRVGLLREALLPLFGPAMDLTIVEVDLLDARGGRFVQYTREG